MSGKRARSFRKKNSLPKKVLALCAGLCFSYAPMAAESEFLVSVFSPFTKPFGETHEMQSGNGAGIKFTYRPVKFFDVFVQGEYLNMQMPGIDPINLFDASVGAGYHFIISDRFSLDLSASGGAYTANARAGNMSGFTAGLSIGFSYKISPVISVDTTASGTHYASSPTPLMTVNAGVAPGVTFNVTQMFNKSAKVNMDVNELSPVFPALYSWYEKNSFGKVTITNNEDTAITDITVSFYQPQYMAHPKECKVIRKIEKGESVDVDLIAFFNEQMLELTEMSETNSSIIVNYLCLGQKRSKSFALDVPVYGRNNMSWDDDRRAAVFVSSKDPAAMHFAKYVTSIVREKKRSTVPLNIQYAMGIFEALNQFGINYVVDPSSAFEDNIGTTSIDFLQYPYQTLMFKGGDCDDLSILVCSLFEAVGIRTAFITIPGHIFMAFDSGMKVEEAEEKLRNLGNYIEIENEVWIPLEITLSDEGFYRAYRYGAREWNKSYSEGTAALYRMQDSWAIYPPISVPGATEKFTMPAKKQISLSFEKSVDQWSFAELKDILDLKPVKLAEATGDLVPAQTEETTEIASAVIIEDPFSMTTLYDILELSGQAVAMNTVSGVKSERRKDDENDSDKNTNKEPEPDDDEEEEYEFDDEIPVLPVVAVNVPGPEVLGIYVPENENKKELESDKIFVASVSTKKEIPSADSIKTETVRAFSAKKETAGLDTDRVEVSENIMAIADAEPETARFEPEPVKPVESVESAEPVVIAVNVPGPEELGIIVPGKVEIAKVDPVKTETAKFETENTETAKTETARIETPKPETIRTETARIETVKPETSTTENSKVETPKPETSTTENSRVETASTESAKNETTRIETSSTESAKNETTRLETSGTESAKNETAKVETASTESAKNETTRIETASTESAKTEITGVDATITENAKTESVRVETANPETATTENARAESVKSETTTTETVKTEVARAETKTKHIPVIPIAAAGLTAGAAAGIIIASKKKKNEGGKE